MSNVNQAISPALEVDEGVVLQFPVPAMSTQLEDRSIYHFRVVSRAYQLRKYLASALANRPYRLSHDAEYMDGMLRFHIRPISDGPQKDFLEPHKVYAQASQDVMHALHYLANPVDAVNDGLASGRPKAEYQRLYSAVSDIVQDEQGQKIEAAVFHEDEKASVSGTIATREAHKEAQRQLKPPVERRLETGTWIFVGRDADGVLTTENGEYFDPGEHLGKRIELDKPIALAVEVEKSRVCRDARKIARVLEEDEDSDE